MAEKNIPKNEVINKNIDMLVSDKFWNMLMRESIGGNAGKMHAGVNAFYNSIGEITKYSNYPPQNGEKRVTFSVNMDYVFDYRKWYEKIYKPKLDKWIIDAIYFDDKHEDGIIKGVIEDAVSYVNSLSKKQMNERNLKIQGKIKW